MFTKHNKGFEGRVFLTEHEWNTFTKRMPVRFVRYKKAPMCAHCGGEETKENPFQNSHIIAFQMGVIDLGLTPEFLDAKDNIRTAHRTTCNKAVELSLEQSMVRLRTLGITNIPAYLPAHVHDVWSSGKTKWILP